MTAIQDAHAEGIPISAIRSTLTQEWQRLSSYVAEETGSPPLRAATSTLVLIVGPGDEYQRAREALHQLASVVPSRAILFVLDEERSTPVAHVWAHCTIGDRHRPRSCYDVIEIELPHNRIEAIPNMIAVHRLGQLPTFVIWNGVAEFESSAFHDIAVLADRLVVDSERFSDPLKALQRYARLLESEGSSVVGSDLVWTRLSTWREIIAQSFDASNTRRFAPEIREIDLSYDASQASGAILLVSWVISRLGLEPQDVLTTPSALSLRARSPDGNRQLNANLHQSRLSGAGLRSVRLLARSGSETVKISIINDDRGRSIHRIDCTGMPRQERVVHHQAPPRNELIAAELLRHSRDSVFEKSLAVGAQIQHIAERNIS